MNINIIGEEYSHKYFWIFEYLLHYVRLIEGATTVTGNWSLDATPKSKEVRTPSENIKSLLMEKSPPLILPRCMLDDSPSVIYRCNSQEAGALCPKAQNHAGYIYISIAAGGRRSVCTQM